MWGNTCQRISSNFSKLDKKIQWKHCILGMVCQHQPQVTVVDFVTKETHSPVLFPNNSTPVRPHYRCGIKPLIHGRFYRAIQTRWTNSTSTNYLNMLKQCQSVVFENAHQAALVNTMTNIDGGINYNVTTYILEHTAAGLTLKLQQFKWLQSVREFTSLIYTGKVD